MRGIGNQDLLARIALRLVIRAHHQQPGEFTMRARRRCSVIASMPVISIRQSLSVS